MAKKPLTQETKNSKDEKISPPAAKQTVAKAPEKVDTSKSAQQKKGMKAPIKAVKVEPVPVPVKPIKPPKVKRPRFVREKKEKSPVPQTKPAPLPARSTKVFAKLMSKNLALPPKEESNFGSLPKP